MLCKLTSKNQLTLPKNLLKDFSGLEYFDARSEDGKIILTPMVVRPVEPAALSEIRNKIYEMGIDENDIASYVAETRDAGSH